jgi:hypothetical protein
MIVVGHPKTLISHGKMLEKLMPFNMILMEFFFHITIVENLSKKWH